MERLAGPLSDLHLFQRSIMNTASLKSTKFHLILYDKNGKELKVTVNCEPLMSGGIFVGCIANIRQCQAVALQSVLTTMKQSSISQCLVSLEAPHTIQMLNDAFVSKFGFARDDLLGKQLPALAPLLHVSASHDWRSLLLATGDGAIRRRSISALNVTSAANSAPFAPFEEAVFVPVADEPDGMIRHVLVLFPPSILPAPIPSSSPRSSSFWTDRLAGCEPRPARRADAVSPLTAKSASPQSLGSDPEDLNDFSGGETTTAAAQPSPDHRSPGDSDHAPAARSRRRIIISANGTAEDVPTAAVVFTPALLDTLRGRPLPAAARAVGVSVTAFKRACRRLGIRRWGFRRGPARGSHDAACTPPPPPPHA